MFISVQELDLGEDVDDRTFRERFRVPRDVLNWLEQKLHDNLKFKTDKINQCLSPRDQIKIFLWFLGRTATTMSSGTPPRLRRTQSTGPFTASAKPCS
jgi:hypothetical protein